MSGAAEQLLRAAGEAGGACASGGSGPAGQHIGGNPGLSGQPGRSCARLLRAQMPPGGIRTIAVADNIHLSRA